MKKDLLKLLDLTREDITEILDTADQMKYSQKHGIAHDYLKGKTLAMIFEKKIGIKLCISGCVGALALIVTGVISEKDALKSIDLKTIFLFGGTLSLASALYHDKLHVQYGNHGTDGSNLSLHRPGHGC